MINLTVPQTVDQPMRGSTAMLLEEALARSRAREAQQTAHEYRLARQLTAGRTWQWLARWAARQADRARQHL
jgi:hypothetical protein